MTIHTYSTLPKKGESFWQIVLIPTLSILKGHDYMSITGEWLFWNFNILVKTN